MVRIRGVRCAISTDGHLLKDGGVLITNPKHVDFARKRRKDFRPENRVCIECAKVFIHLYNMKIRSAKEKKERHSLTVSSSSSLDDFDRIVYQTPRTKHLRDFVKQNAPLNLGGRSQELSENVEKANIADNYNDENTSCESSTHALMVSDDNSISSIVDVGLKEPSKSGDHEIISDISDGSQNLSQDVRPTINASATAIKEVRSEENISEPNDEVVREIVSKSQDVRPTINASATATDEVSSENNNSEPNDEIVREVVSNISDKSHDVRSTINASATAADEVSSENNNSEPNDEIVREVVSNISDKSHDVRSTINAATTATNELRNRENNKGQAKITTTDSSVWRKPSQPAKRKIVHTAQQPIKKYFAANLPVSANSSTTSDDDFDDFQPSLNALNGTRLPHIQPIPKRRQFQHPIPTVHNIYMQGITGG